MRLDDFFHIPALASALVPLTTEPPELIVVAGLDLPTAVSDETHALVPSGRATIFRLLADDLLGNQATRAAVITSDEGQVRVSRAQRTRVALMPVQGKHTYTTRIKEALRTNAQQLIIDQVAPDHAALLASALGAGVRVLTQINSAARGVALLHDLGDQGLDGQQLPGRTSLIAVQRLPRLCTHCRYEQALSGHQQALLRVRTRGPFMASDTFFVAKGCEHCQDTGRNGTVAIFDIMNVQYGATAEAFLFEPIVIAEQYARELALCGELAFDDAIDLDTALTHRLFRQFTTNDQALALTNQQLQRNVAELRATNSVLERRTAALSSLQAVGQALISCNDLDQLAEQICQNVCDLCDADCVVLYGNERDGWATILAVSGWSHRYIGKLIESEEIATDSSEPTPFDQWPPGIPEQSADLIGGTLRAGLCVPLMAEGQQVGMLIIHSMRRKRFEPSQITLLQTFAHQAALSVQRARLIEQLNDNLAQLQQAQAALVQQQRLAREMELAAEVQQSILPHVFPQLPGLAFAAENRPARQVGGDFYDVFLLDEHTIGLVIADVSGKGMPAALYMALTRSLLLAESRRERSPRLALYNVNRLLREVGDPHMFITVFYGVLDVASRKLIYARAGHDYPLLFRNGQIEQLMGHGTVLGMLELNEMNLSEEHIALQTGDRLVLYTDGLIDVVNAANQRFELPRLEALLAQLHGTPDEICSATFAALAEYQGSAEQYDDMTLLVVGVD